LPNIGLKTWGKGDRLSAEQLNHNFAALLGAIEICMVAALSPDQSSVQNEVALAAHATRLDTLERMQLMHDRQRNEKQWAPLAHVAALMQLMLEIRGPLSDRADELLAAQGEARTRHVEHDRRLARLEQQPEPATREDCEALAKEVQRLSLFEHNLLVQVHALRRETHTLIEMAKGHARQRNEMEYAPLAVAGHLLQRVKDIEARLPREAP
jgi:hypothetical protein